MNDSGIWIIGSKRAETLVAAFVNSDIQVPQVYRGPDSSGLFLATVNTACSCIVDTNDRVRCRKLGVPFRSGMLFRLKKTLQIRAFVSN
jgi:hypothetical protein